MYNDIDPTRTGNQKVCLNNSLCVADYARNFPKDIIHLSDQDVKKWYVTLAYKPTGLSDKGAEEMISFDESGHPVFRGSSFLSRGTLKSKDGGKTTIHHNAEHQSVLLLPSISSVFTEQSRIGAELLISEQKIIFHEVQENLLQKCPMTKLRKFRLSLLYHVTKNSTWNSKAQ